MWKKVLLSVTSDLWKRDSREHNLILEPRRKQRLSFIFLHMKISNAKIRHLFYTMHFRLPRAAFQHVQLNYDLEIFAIHLESILRQMKLRNLELCDPTSSSTFIIKSSV